MKTLVKLVFRATEPSITRLALEGTRLSAGSRDPLASPRHEIAQTTTGKAFEAKVMMLIHGTIPPKTFVRAGKSYVNLLQVETDGRCGQKV